jgi:type VI secretion system protein ImpL
MTKRKLLILVLVFLVYTVLVWFMAYAFFPDSPVVVGLILTVCGLTLLFVYILISRLTSRLASPPAPTPSPEPSAPPSARAAPARDEDLEPIASIIAEANDRLAKSPTLANSKVQPSVTALPLYLLLGVEGSGKTSAFVASELSPELLAGEAFRDSAVVPTRVLNLWFAGGCVVAEPSGRFFSEDPSRLQRLVATLLGKRGTSWMSKIFSGQNQDSQFKGVILCCPIDGFLGVPDAARQAALVRRIQERLRTIGEALRADFPVYIIFTKCDVLPYFGEYFYRVTETEERQILGCTLPISAIGGRGQMEVYADAQTKRISEFFNRLYYSLAEHRATFLRRETNRAKKPSIYEFPRELKRIRGTLVQFLVDIFRPNPLQPGPLLRGFYFMGTRKVPTGQAIASRAKLGQTGSYKFGEATRLFRREELQKARIQEPEQVSDTSALTEVWSFVADLFRQTIVSDRDRVGGAFVDRRLGLYRRIAFASILLVCLVASVMFVVSWFGNRSLLHEARTAGDESKPPIHTGAPTPDNLDQIEKLRVVLKRITDYRDHGKPWKLDFGLYTGNAVFWNVRAVYFKRFREYFLDKIVHDTEAKLGSLPRTQDPAHDYQSVHADLKGYLTITTPEGRRCSPDADFAGWVVGPWQGTGQAERQFSFYVDELRAKRDPYSDLQSAPVAVKTARNYLLAYSGIEPLYAEIISEINQELPAVARLSDYSQKGPDALVLNGGTEVPAAFTAAGWDLVQKKIANKGQGGVGNPCVLGYAQSASGLLQVSDNKRRLMNIYVKAYIDRWKSFLGNTNVQRYRDDADAAHKLEVLSGNGSPLLAVLAMVAENTKLPQTSQASSLMSKIESKGKQGLLDRIRGRAPSAIRNVVPQNQPEETLGPEKIEQVFQPARMVFKAPDRNHLTDDVNTRYISALLDLQMAMNALAQQSDPQSNVELNNRANEKVQAALREARQLTLKFDSSPDAVGETVSKFLEEPIRAVEPLVVTDFGKVAKGKLDGAMRELCKKLSPMLRKFPFNPQADQEVDLAQFQAMFAPASGAFWSFHKDQTAKMLELRGHVWAQKSDSDTKLSDRFLRFFNGMARITEALFPPDGDRAQMQFKLIMQASQGIQSISGSVDGDEFSTGAKQYSWPGQNPGIDLRVLQSGNINSSTFAKYEGVWGLFRWMQSAENRAAGSASFGFVNQRATRGSQPQPILDNGTPIKIQVVEFPNKVDTVFDKDFFTGLECPVRATQ